MNKSTPHASMRGFFAYYLYEEMEKNPNIYLITADLGYGMFDQIQASFCNRFLNTGASEQTALDIAVGLAMSGKIPFVYTITPFLTRGFETIRNYINHENIPVIMVGAGRDKDYAHDGFSHYADDIPEIMELFRNVVDYYPVTKEELTTLIPTVVNLKRPVFLSLKR